MPSRSALLNLLKKTIIEARELSANPPASSNPFDQASGTNALDALKLGGNVISDADLAKLLDDVDKAKHDDEMWKKVLTGIGSLLGGLLKGAIVLAVASLFLVGCSGSSRLPIIQAHMIEGEAVDAFVADHDKIVDALFADLQDALLHQLDLIEKYELQIRSQTFTEEEIQTLLAAFKKKQEANPDPHEDEGAAAEEYAAGLRKRTLSGDEVQKLLDQERAKRKEIVAKLAEHRVYIETAKGNIVIAKRIHEAIEQFLKRDGFTAEDAEALLAQVADLRKKD